MAGETITQQQSGDFEEIKAKKPKQMRCDKWFKSKRFLQLAIHILNLVQRPYTKRQRKQYNFNMTITIITHKRNTNELVIEEPVLTMWQYQ
eukprot:9996816-Heterocapsa_arctica.AAC.1